MAFNDRLSGRKEKRHALIVAVDIAPLAGNGDEKRERTYTENISAHGARVHSTQAWQTGEQVEITPLKDDPVWGEVVYCQKHSENEFFVGIRFRQKRILSILERFGMAIMGIF